MLFMSRAALCDAAQYSDQASLNQATGSLLLASADCSLIVQVICQEAILSSALLQHPPWTQLDTGNATTEFGNNEKNIFVTEAIML